MRGIRFFGAIECAELTIVAGHDRRRCPPCTAEARECLIDERTRAEIGVTVIGQHTIRLLPRKQAVAVDPITHDCRDVDQ